LRLLARPNPKVVAQAQRRKFSAADKRRILNLADICTDPGEIGVLLRREGIYSLHLVIWRKHRKTSELTMLVEKKLGPKPNLATADARLVLKLTRENVRLRDKLALVGISSTFKKLSILLDLTSADALDEPKP
jgi:transposase